MGTVSQMANLGNLGDLGRRCHRPIDRHAGGFRLRAGACGLEAGAYSTTWRVVVTAWLTVPA